MNELQVFNNAEFGKLRTIRNGDKLLFCGSDVAKALGYANAPDAMKKHCKQSGIAKCDSVDNLGRKNILSFIDEGNVYRLITHSKLPEAEKFESWVFDEVLPTIHKHGAYMTPETLEAAILNPDTMIRLCTALKEEQKKNKTLALDVERMKPKEIFADAVTTSDSCILVGDLAKLLKQNGIDIGANRLFKWLRENKYLIKRKGTDYNTPTQRAMEMGLFQVKETAITHSDGHVTVNKTTKVTGKGQLYFINKFKETA